MQTLHEYIAAEGLTQEAAAERIGISRSYLSEILSGAKLPGRKTIELIEIATGGRVPASTWFARGADRDDPEQPTE